MSLADASPSLLCQVDPVFQSSYARSLAITGTPESGQVVCSKRESRFYNLLSIHRWVAGIPGWQVECGCWKGLSSYLLNEQAKRLKPSHDGAGCTQNAWPVCAGIRSHSPTPRRGPDAAPTAN